jgi:cytochrome bd-type quinol oxidase subunit 1
MPKPGDTSPIVTVYQIMFEVILCAIFAFGCGVFLINSARSKDHNLFVIFTSTAIAQALLALVFGWKIHGDLKKLISSIPRV